MSKRRKKRIRIIWTVIVIIGVFAMVLFTLLPAFGNYGSANPY
jgi:predicted nucleic acid-binding Zn ribbon protein